MTQSEARAFLQKKFREYGMTQAEIANEMLIISPVTLSRYINGKITWPLDIKVKLAHTLGISSAKAWEVFDKAYANPF